MFRMGRMETRGREPPARGEHYGRHRIHAHARERRLKLQLTENTMRVRVDEAELARLLTGTTLTLCVVHAGRSLLRLQTVLGHEPGFAGDSSWTLVLPRDAVCDYVRTLPRRDALRIALSEDESLVVMFEVDVRDSVRVRKAPSAGR